MRPNSRENPVPPPRRNPPPRTAGQDRPSRDLTGPAIGACLLLAIVLALVFAMWSPKSHERQTVGTGWAGDSATSSELDDRRGISAEGTVQRHEAAGSTNQSPDSDNVHEGSGLGVKEPSPNAQQREGAVDESAGPDEVNDVNANPVDSAKNRRDDEGAQDDSGGGKTAQDTNNRTRDYDLHSFNTLTSAIGDETRTPIELALDGRSGKTKAGLLARFGGGEDTEAAVELALEWLSRNQLDDGSWSLRGPYTSGGNMESSVAATAMALLAYLGAGHTPAEGKYKKEVQRGIQVLLKTQGRDGRFGNGVDRQNGQLYAQAQATIAICELYGMTKSITYRGSAQRAVNYAADIQSPEGGWRYRPGVDADTSVTGWFAMALQSALMAELNVRRESLDRVSSYLDKAASSDGSRYAYQPPGQNSSVAMTAEALLCRQYLGWLRSDKRLVSGIAYVNAAPVAWSNSDVYAWYYATQVVHNVDGADWSRWNDRLKPVLLENQEIHGPEAGSWPNSQDRYGRTAGRLYVTCLCVWMLETYYRHLPLYGYRI